MGASATNYQEIVQWSSQVVALKMYLNETFTTLKLDGIQTWLKVSCRSFSHFMSCSDFFPNSVRIRKILGGLPIALNFSRSLRIVVRLDELFRTLSEIRFRFFYHSLWIVKILNGIVKSPFTYFQDSFVILSSSYVILLWLLGKNHVVFGLFEFLMLFVLFIFFIHGGFLRISLEILALYIKVWL